ncbi:MAG: pyrroline-5-carboxylate reductase dimerization domain-containing protein [Anaerolineae bacterium]|jgi:pyrroline-5-carboxylate reductase
MNERIGIIGVGHLAGYLVEGLQRADSDLEIVLSPRNVTRSARLAARFGATVAQDNQAVADEADLILLTTRPGDALAAARGITFRPGQTVVSTVAGLSLAALRPAVAPATGVRAMPISCAALNQSPTLLCPDQAQARALFALLGQVHLLPDESHLTAASVISAFYGWVYALLDETVTWTVGAGVPAETARSLVLETVRGAANMGLAQPDRDLADMLDTLATPGGITELGLDVLRQRHGLEAWAAALDAVLARMQGGQ